MTDGSVTLHPMRRLLSNRRGLLAGAAALVGAGLAKVAAPGRAEASHDTTTAPTATNVLHVGVINDGGNAANDETATSITTTTTLVASSSGAAALRAHHLQSGSGTVGVQGIGGHVGVHGRAFGGGGITTGVLGESDVAAVLGSSVSTVAQSVGVLGFLTDAMHPTPTYNTSAGVLGITRSGLLGAGVAGVATSDGLGSTAVNTGVYGQSDTGTGVQGTSTAGIAVSGQSTTGTAVQGLSTNGIGVYGQSTNNYGCGGATSKPGFAGLFGFAGVASAAGFLGVNGAPGGTAGYFHGAVTVDGPFQVVNGPKNALVAHPDGSHRRMYCQESPEPWFEDFGRGQVVAGTATVRLDQDFAAVVKNDDYFVFLTEGGDLGGLYVPTQGPTSFEVRARNQAASGGFQYRVVARRKDDVGKRMEKVELPKFDLRPPAPPETPPGQDKRPPR